MSLHVVTVKTWGVFCDACGASSDFGRARDAHCPACARDRGLTPGLEWLLVQRVDADGDVPTVLLSAGDLRAACTSMPHGDNEWHTAPKWPGKAGAA